MTDLRIRFGKLVAYHRRREGLTQEALAERAGISVDMVSKVEVGASGARFPVIERLATALNIDPADLFTSKFGPLEVSQQKHSALLVRLNELSDTDASWALDLLEVALRPRK